MPEQSQTSRISWLGSSRRRRAAACLLAILFVGALIALGPWLGAMVARRIASTHINACRFGPAQRWLGFAAWLRPGDYRTDLLRAVCHRQLGQTEAWIKTLDAAQRNGAPGASLALQRKLHDFQAGRLYPGAETEMHALATAGATPKDLFTVFLRAYLAQGNIGMARIYLETLAKVFPDQTHREYLWGVFWRRQGEMAEAQKRLTAVLEAQPDHELARLELAELFEELGRLAPALREHVELVQRGGDEATAAPGLARVLRKQGRLDEARAVLASQAAKQEPETAVRLEMAEIALLAGRYEEADRGLASLAREENRDTAILSARARALAFQGKVAEAQLFLAKTADLRGRDGWIADLRNRLANNPNDAAAAEELRRMARPTSAELLPKGASAAKPAAEGRSENLGAAGELFAQHCSTCHGINGEGRGLAARPLFPRARDLRTGRSRLVSTLNGIATLEDLEGVLAPGMPGTSMPAFDKLSPTDRKLLAQLVLQWRREGVRDQIVAMLRQEGEEIREAEVRAAAEQQAAPGPPVALPRDWSTAQAARGKAAYESLGCAKCHGDDGRGAADQLLFDELGEPTRPRDLVCEPFKGGHEREAVYLRLAAGMPGTAHPGAWTVAQAELIDLVEYVRSLAQQPPRTLTNHQRRVLADSRSYLASFKEPSAP